MPAQALGIGCFPSSAQTKQEKNIYQKSARPFASDVVSASVGTDLGRPWNNRHVSGRPEPVSLWICFLLSLSAVVGGSILGAIAPRIVKQAGAISSAATGCKKNYST